MHLGNLCTLSKYSSAISGYFDTKPKLLNEKSVEFNHLVDTKHAGQHSMMWRIKQLNSRQTHPHITECFSFMKTTVYEKRTGLNNC